MSDINKSITELPKTQFSGLEFKNIMQDIHALVQENPDYNQNWDDFLNSNAGRMLTEIFAKIADQLATRIDWVVNESFIGTATQRSSIIKLLKLIGYKFNLPVAAQVPVTATFSQDVGEITITPAYVEGSAQLFPKTLQGIDKDGNLRNFEAIQYDSLNQKYSYKVPVTLDSSKEKDEFYFHEGRTVIQKFISTSNAGQKFILSETPIVQNSVVVYKIEREGTEVRELELLEVNSFLDSKAQKAADISGTNAIPYVLNVRSDDSVEIEFGPQTLLPTQDRRLGNGVEIYVFYRVGGGLNGNIARQAINSAEKRRINGDEVLINYKNLREGIGGTNSETVENAAYKGPLTLRTGGKTVTPEDYDIILNSNSSILKAKSYGYNNIPQDYFEKYGLYFNPLDVINFIIMKKPGWESRPTSKYYLSDWGTLNLENRFNGEYWWTNGKFGNEIPVKTIPITLLGDYNFDGVGKEFKNFTILQTPQDFKESIFIEDPNDPNGYIANPDMVASITLDEFDRKIHTKINQLNDHLVHDTQDPYFYGSYNNTDLPRVEIREDIQAYFIPTRDVSGGLNISTGRDKFVINIDKQGDVTVDLSKGGVSPAIVPVDTQDTPYVEGIIDIINNSISSAYYNVKAYQDFGILIEDRTAQVPNLENRDEEDWILRITGIDYTVDLGVDQTYEQILIQMNTAINVAGYEAIFIQNRVNITCWDIRIQRMDDTGTVVLEDSNNPFDILVGFGASPLSTTPVSSGDYSNVASKIVDDQGVHIKLTSPNSGSTSIIELKDYYDTSRTCLLTLFGLDGSLLPAGLNAYTCYGQRALTVIYGDTEEPDFADFIYEHGTINFTVHDPDVVYLNYIKEKADKIRLGTYFNESFSIEEPEWKEKDKRIYNTQYIIDPTDEEGKRELFDIDNSNILLKFTQEETEANSIYVIQDDYSLKRATETSIQTKDLGTFPDLTNRILTIQINDNEPKALNLNGVSSIDDLVIQLNTSLKEQANEVYDNDIEFAERVVEDGVDTDVIKLRIDNIKEGKITILGEVNSAKHLLFNGFTETDNDVIYPNGDFYLNHNEVTDEIEMVKIGDNTDVPDVPFYIHYISDRRHVFKDPDVLKIKTDEDDLQGYMQPYKVAGVQNIFFRPVFSTFDIKGNIYISTAFPKQQVQFNVQSALKNAYSLSSAEFNRPVIKSEVTKIIMNVPGVRYVEISYFGKDMTDDLTNNDNRINVGFDEIMVLSDDTFDADGEQTHGQDLTYNIV